MVKCCCDEFYGGGDGICVVAAMIRSMVEDVEGRWMVKCCCDEVYGGGCGGEDGW